MARSCPQGPGSCMKDGRRHLHELEVRRRFRFPGGSTVYRLTRLGRMHCTIRGEGTVKHVRFTDANGEVREFQARRSGERPCAPAAVVIPFTSISDEEKRDHDIRR